MTVAAVTKSAFSDIDGGISSKRIIAYAAMLLIAIAFLAHTFWAVPVDYSFLGILETITLGSGALVASEKFAPGRPLAQVPEIPNNVTK